MHKQGLALSAQALPDDGNTLQAAPSPTHEMSGVTIEMIVVDPG